ncbi:MAG: hypothetical protein C5B59_11080 [Bacteroidetes bacterium]|nr:MAG: hypothetical protein C5B59_11080 [Bacteroidota bacterium]
MLPYFGFGKCPDTKILEERKFSRPLPNQHTTGYNSVTGISVSGSDVYVSGYIDVTGNTIATHWKNGVSNYLTDGTTNAYATGVAIQVNDVLISGYIYPKYRHNCGGILEEWAISRNVQNYHFSESHEYLLGPATIFFYIGDGNILGNLRSSQVIRFLKLSQIDSLIVSKSNCFLLLNLYKELAGNQIKFWHRFSSSQRECNRSPLG